MNRILINDSLDLCLPDGFHVMDVAERSSLKLLNDGPSEFVTDPDRHITLSVGWRKAPLISYLLLNTKDAAKAAERSISGPMGDYGYESLGHTSAVIGGLELAGFCFRYTASGIAMMGEILVAKHSGHFYYFNYYTREALWEENLSVYRLLLSESKWTKK